MKTRSSAIWVTLCLSALGLGAVTVYVRQTPQLPLHDQAEKPALAPTPAPQTEKPSTETKQVAKITIYTPTMSADGISFTKKETEVPDGQDPKVFAVNQFLTASEVVGSDAKALDVDLHEDGSAVIDFTKAFNQTYGAFDEKKLLDGLAATLGQFDDVKQFTLMADGEPVKTLGNADLTAPIPVTRPADVPSQPSFTKSPTGDEPPKP